MRPALYVVCVCLCVFKENLLPPTKTVCGSSTVHLKVRSSRFHFRDIGHPLPHTSGYGIVQDKETSFIFWTEDVKT